MKRDENIRCSSSIIHAKDSLASSDEGVEIVALAILVALLVQCPVEVRYQRRHLVQVVLQSNRQPSLVCLLDVSQRKER